MTLCFAHFCGPEAGRRRQRALEAVRAAWESLRASDSRCTEPFQQALRGIDERLHLEPEQGHFDWVVTYDELEARGLAELVAAEATSWRVSVGRPARSTAGVVDTIGRDAKLDLARARVRAGFTRGHQLEVVVALPLECSRSEEPRALAERLVEGLLGEAFVDDWVAAVGISYLSREGPLQVLRKDEDSPPTYPLESLVDIAARAVEGVDSLLPEVPRCSLPGGAEWTWLEMSPDPNSPQPDRVAAATCAPELLKSALEGGGFHSRRFSRCGERFVWMSMPAVRGSERAERRESVERRFDDALRSAALGTIIGTGFGAEREYFDVCLAPSDDALAVVTSVARQLELPADAHLGFYDTRWAEERVPLG